MGNKLGAIGGILMAGDIVYNSEIRTSHIINGAMIWLSFSGVGAIVAGVWFIADLGTGFVMGTSISERIDNSVGAPLVDWDYD